MIGRNKRGIRRVSMRVRLAVAAAVLVGGGAAGVAAVAASHSGPTSATSAGYSTNYNQTLSESQAMSSAMNWWSKSPQTSLVVITEMTTIRTISTTPFHSHMLVVQRGTVVTKDPWEFVVKSTNGQFELWHATGGTKFVNVGGTKTGWNAMSGGTMSSYGDWNWSNSSNSNWNMNTKTLAKGDLVFVFGEKVHGKLVAQLVLFAAPKFTQQTPVTPSTATPAVNAPNQQVAPQPNTNGGNGSTFSGSHS